MCLLVNVMFMELWMGRLWTREFDVERGQRLLRCSNMEERVRSGN